MNYSAMGAQLSAKLQSLPTPPEWDLLLSASQKNNVSVVRRLLDEDGVPPSHSNIVGQTALHIAALWGSVEVTEVLIEAGANVNAQNQIANMTPLHCAIRGTFQSFKETHSRRLQCVKLLLAAGADGKLCDKKGRDAFECIEDAVRESVQRNVGSIEEEMKEMREALESTGLNMSPLAKSIEEMDVEGVKRCLSEGNDTVPAEEGENAISATEINKGLLAASGKFKSLLTDENSTDIDAYKSLAGIISTLLDAGGDANALPPMSATPDPLEEAPLHIIASSICAACTQSPDAALAAMDSASEIITNLRSRGGGAKVGSITMALLPDAARRGTLPSTKFLIDTVGVNPNYRGRQGMTPLIFASRGGKKNIVEWLLTYSGEQIDVGSADDAGKTALDYATANGKDEIVKLLQQKS